jgi:hypothetical protein
VETYLPDRRLTIFRSERMTPYTSLDSSSKGRPALEAAPPPTPPWVCTGGGGGGGGGGVAVADAGKPGDWLPSLYAMRTPELEARVLRGLEKGVPDAEPGAEPEPEPGPEPVPVEGRGRGRGESACETPGRRSPPSFARFGRFVRCQS